MAVKSGYVNGSDMLLFINGKAVGHCTSHNTKIDAETKDRAVKPVASASASTSLYKNKGVVGISISISAEGLVTYDETENGYQELFAAMVSARSVDVKCMERGAIKPYLVGKFVMTTLERTDPAQDDSTYSISLENDGAPTTLDETAITDTTEDT